MFGLRPSLALLRTTCMGPVPSQGLRVLTCTVGVRHLPSARWRGAGGKEEPVRARGGGRRLSSSFQPRITRQRLCTHCPPSEPRGINITPLQMKKQASCLQNSRSLGLKGKPRGGRVAGSGEINRRAFHHSFLQYTTLEPSHAA